MIVKIKKYRKNWVCKSLKFIFFHIIFQIGQDFENERQSGI